MLFLFFYFTSLERAHVVVLAVWLDCFVPSGLYSFFALKCDIADVIKTQTSPPFSPSPSSYRGSVIGAVPTRCPADVPGTKRQPAPHRPASSRSPSQSADSTWPHRRPAGAGCTATTAGNLQQPKHFIFFLHTRLSYCRRMGCDWLAALLIQVTIQVQDVELGGGAQRPGSFLSTPGGHRVLGKQLSADNAETHRWPPLNSQSELPLVATNITKRTVNSVFYSSLKILFFSSFRRIWLCKHVLTVCSFCTFICILF